MFYVCPRAPATRVLLEGLISRRRVQLHNPWSMQNVAIRHSFTMIPREALGLEAEELAGGELLAGYGEGIVFSAEGAQE